MLRKRANPRLNEHSQDVLVSAEDRPTRRTLGMKGMDPPNVGPMPCGGLRVRQEKREHMAAGSTKATGTGNNATRGTGTDRKAKAVHSQRVTSVRRITIQHYPRDVMCCREVSAFL